MSVEAMKQALEALEALNKVSIGVDAVCLPGEIDTAMDALRQAIEQAEKHGPEPIDHLLAENARLWGLIYDLHKKIAPDTTQAGAGDCTDGERLYAELKAKEQAEKQEPMALETVYETIIHWDEGGGKRSRRELAKRIVDLYTTPQPQREWVGLTDEDEIDWDGGDLKSLVKAIEAKLKEKNA